MKGGDLVEKICLILLLLGLLKIELVDSDEESSSFPFDPRRKHCVSNERASFSNAGKENCGNWVCGRSPCQSCSPATWEGDTSNQLCYSRPEGPEISCQEDKNCEVWQTCLALYERRYDKRQVRKRFCVDTSAFSFKGDLPPTPMSVLNDGIEGNGDAYTPTATPSEVNERTPTVQPSQASPPTVLPTMAPSKSQNLCYANKRIIIETGASGMSNRLYAIVSATILAALTERVLEVKWIKDKGCGVKFTDLFVHNKKGSKLMITADEDVMNSVSENGQPIVNPFVLNQAESPDIKNLPNTVYRNESVCRLRFNQHEPEHFLALYDPNLFEMIDTRCHVIHIKANSYFAKHILDWDKTMFRLADRGSIFFNQLRSRLKRFKFLYSNPFHDVMNVFYRPTEEVERITSNYMKDVLDGPYLAIHTRGFYDDGDGTKDILKCANQLLTNKNISYIFFATESQHLRELARRSIPKVALKTFKKRYIDDMEFNADTFGRYRSSLKDMQTAVVEWSIVGNGKFCMSPTVAVSTFSQTSIVAGSCKYIPFDKKAYRFRKGYDCAHIDAIDFAWPYKMDPLNVQGPKEKEKIASNARQVLDAYSDIAKYQPRTKKLRDEDLQRIWKSIRYKVPTPTNSYQEYEHEDTSNMEVWQQCFKEREDLSAAKSFIDSYYYHRRNRDMLNDANERFDDVKNVEDSKDEKK